MSQRAIGKFKRIFKSYVIPISLTCGVIYGVSKLVGSPSEVYREIEVVLSVLESFYSHPVLGVVLL